MVPFGVVVWLVSLVCATNFLSVISVDGLVYNYYNESCPNAEAIIQKTVYNLYKHTQDNIPTSLIRWSFHDFFNVTTSLTHYLSFLQQIPSYLLTFYSKNEINNASTL